MATLCVVEPLDPASGERPVVRASSIQDRRVTALDDKIWMPALFEEPKLSIQLFDGSFESAIEPGGCALSIQTDVLSDRFPDIERYLWAGAAVTIYHGHPGDAWPWREIYRGRTRGFEKQAGSLKLTTSVDIEPFGKDVLAVSYAGTGGAEGPADLKGTLKPWIFGWAANVVPVLVDADNSVYQFSGYGPIEAVSALYERGSSFGPPTANHASYAELVAANIPAGRWATCLAAGMVRLGAPQYGVITGDVRGHRVGASTLRRTGAILSTIGAVIGVEPARINTASLNALDAAVPYNVNLVLTDQTSFIDLARRMALPCNAQAGVSLTGQLFTVRVEIGAAAMVLDAQGKAKPQVTSNVESDVSPPFAKTVFGAARAWRVHNYDEIAFGAELLDRGSYSGTETYREGNIVDQLDGSRWLYVSTEPGAGVAPQAGSSYWSMLSGPTVVDFGTGVTGPGKPEDNATYGNPFGTPFGDRTPEEVLSAIADGNGDLIPLAQVASDIAAAQAELQTLDDDGIFSAFEKRTVLHPRDKELEDRYQALIARADAWGVAHADLDAGRTGYLDKRGQVLNWANAQVDSPLNAFNRLLWDAGVKGYAQRLAQLAQTLDAEAGRRAEWGAIGGAGKPQDDATKGAPSGTKVGSQDVDALIGKLVDVNGAVIDLRAVKDQVTQSATKLQTIDNDGVFTALEKRYILYKEDARNETHYQQMRAKAVALGISVVAVDSTRAAYQNTRDAIPNWANGQVDSVLSNTTRATWDGRVAAFRDEILKLSAAVADAASKRSTWTGTTGAGKPADNATRNTGALADRDSVGTGQIETGAVSPSKIALDDTRNLVPDALMIDPGAWTLPSFRVNTFGYGIAKNVLDLIPGDESWSTLFAVKPGVSYVFEGYAAYYSGSAVYTNSVTVDAIWHDKDGNNFTGGTETLAAKTVDSAPYFRTVRTPPAGTAGCRIRVRCYNAGANPRAGSAGGILCYPLTDLDRDVAEGATNKFYTAPEKSKLDAGLDNNGNVARPLPDAIKNSSNILSRLNGGTYLGDLDAQGNYRISVDGNGFIQGIQTPRRVANDTITATDAYASNLLRRANGGGDFVGELNADRTVGKDISVLVGRTADKIEPVYGRQWAAEAGADVAAGRGFAFVDPLGAAKFNTIPANAGTSLQLTYQGTADATLIGNSITRNSGGGTNYDAAVVGSALAPSAYAACRILAAAGQVTVLALDDSPVFTNSLGDFRFYVQIPAFSGTTGRADFYVNGALLYRQDISGGISGNSRVVLAYDGQRVSLIVDGVVLFSTPAPEDLRLWPKWFGVTAGVTLRDLAAGTFTDNRWASIAGSLNAPTDNADVTGDHTSADTFAVSGQAAGNIRTGADRARAALNASNRINDGRSLNSNNNFGLRSLSQGVSFSDTANGSTVIINLTQGTYYTDWGAQLVMPSASFPGLIYDRVYHIWRIQPDPATIGTGYGISTDLRDALGTGKTYLGSHRTRVEASSPPPPPTSGGGNTQPIVGGGGGYNIP